MVDSPQTYFDQTYDTLYPKVMHYVIAKCSNISDVEDIVQEVFTEFYVSLCKKGANYIKNTEAFVMQITKSKIHRHYTLKERLKILLPLCPKTEEGDEYDHFETDDMDIEEKYINDTTMKEVWHILRAKPGEVQKVFALFYYCDRSIKDIAQELCISESKVKHHLYRTLEDIRTIYNKGGECV